ELFVRLCGFGWRIGNVVPLIFDVQARIYNDQGIDFNSLSHLESLGLIQFDNIAGFLRLKLPKSASVFFYGMPAALTFPNEVDNQLDIGKVLLTRAGQQLAAICGSKPVDGVYEYVYEKWSANGLVPKLEAQPVDPADPSA
ncbi:MAG: hypothetical protein ABIZ64_04130, partial [Casimicrobium sp.]